MTNFKSARKKVEPLSETENSLSKQSNKEERKSESVLENYSSVDTEGQVELQHKWNFNTSMELHHKLWKLQHKVWNLNTQKESTEMTSSLYSDSLTKQGDKTIEAKGATSRGAKLAETEMAVKKPRSPLEQGSG